jgi:hypothetical protein
MSPAHRRAGIAVWAGLCLVFGLALVLVGFETAMHFNGSAIDGPFQLYNALRRIQAGMRPGVDFQYFHGLGGPYLHYWLYRLLGGGLRGSELARELISAALYPVVLIVFFRAFLGDWRRTLCLTAAALALSFVLNLSGILFALNGMLGLRSTLPTLLPVVLYLAPTRRMRIVAAGVTLGAALFISTEQGLAAVLAYAIVSAIAVMRGGERKAQVVELAATVALAVATLLLCLFAVGGYSGMRGALRYNFAIVPTDQYWYFGSPPNRFVPSWKDGIVMSVLIWPIGAALLLGIAATAMYVRRYWRAPDGAASRRAFGFAMLAVYALLSCTSLLGVFVAVYVQPCWRAIILLGLLELTAVAERSRDVSASPGTQRWLGVPRAVAAVALAVSAWAIVTRTLIPTVFTDALPHVIRDHVFGDARFSVYGIWPETLVEGQRAIDTHRGPHGEPPVLWSTYAGWIEARNGLFHPSFDYIIHALGTENRRAYVETFKAIKPTLVQTVLPTYTQYEPWIENNDWEFYDALLQSYVVSSTTPWSIFWERRPTPAPEPELMGTMTVPAGMEAVALPPIPASSAELPTLVEVEVEYDVQNPLHWLPIVGQSPRYIVGINDAVSRLPVALNPFVHQKRFPLLVRAGQHPTLFFRTLSLLPGASWTPRRLRVFRRPVDPRNEPWLAALTTQLSR